MALQPLVEWLFNFQLKCCELREYTTIPKGTSCVDYVCVTDKNLPTQRNDLIHGSPGRRVTSHWTCAGESQPNTVFTRNAGMEQRHHSVVSHLHTKVALVTHHWADCLCNMCKTRASTLLCVKHGKRPSWLSVRKNTVQGNMGQRWSSEKSENVRQTCDLFFKKGRWADPGSI